MSYERQNLKYSLDFKIVFGTKNCNVNNQSINIFGTKSLSKALGRIEKKNKERTKTFFKRIFELEHKLCNHLKNKQKKFNLQSYFCEEAARRGKEIAVHGLKPHALLFAEMQKITP